MPKTEAENDELHAYAQDKDFFLGAKDELIEGTFIWDDGTPVVWANWLMPGEASWGKEPNGGRGENCVNMLKQFVSADFKSRWGDTKCTGRNVQQVVCEDDWQVPGEMYTLIY